MDASELTAQLGGTASWADLRRHLSSREIRRAVARGDLERAGRNTYVLAGIDAAVRAAASVGGLASHRSAALLHGWEVWRAPQRPEVTVPKHRNVAPARRPDADLRWREVAAGDARVTEALRTVVDCARDLPSKDALAVADSALRHGAVTEAELRTAIHDLPRKGRGAAEAVLREASGRAANPFESALRALALEAVGPLFEPQVELVVDGHMMRPDLVCEELRIVVEADSFEFHTSRHQLVKDCHRYDELVLDGWLVLRFTWDHVMSHDAWVISTIRRATTMQRLLLARPA